MKKKKQKYERLKQVKKRGHHAYLKWNIKVLLPIIMENLQINTIRPNRILNKLNLLSISRLIRVTCNIY